MSGSLLHSLHPHTPLLSLQRRRVVLAARALPAVAFAAVRLAHCAQPPPPMEPPEAEWVPGGGGTRTPAGALHASAVRAASRAWHETILRLRVTQQGLMRCVALRDTNGRATATLLAAYPVVLAGLGAAHAALAEASEVWAAHAALGARGGGGSSSGRRRGSSSVGGGSPPAGGPSSPPSYVVPPDVAHAAVLGVVLDHLIACLKQRRASGAVLDTRHAAMTAAAAVIGCFPFRSQMRLLRAVLAAAGIHARPQEQPLPAATLQWGGLRLLRVQGGGRGSGSTAGAGGSPLRSGGRNSGGGFAPSSSPQAAPPPPPHPAGGSGSGSGTPLTLTETTVTDAFTAPSPFATAAAASQCSSGGGGSSSGGSPSGGLGGASASDGGASVPPLPSASEAPLVHAVEGLFELTDARDATWRERVLLCRRCVCARPVG